MEKVLTRNKTAKVAIQGAPGCFHHEAAEKYWNGNIDLIAGMTFDDAVINIKSGKADYGILAIENSLAGSIIPNYKLLRNSGLKVRGEISLHIEQHLMALAGQKLEDIKEVHSHPMALQQCKDFFLDYPKIKLVESIDTALSAKIIKEEQIKGRAAIASKLASERYGLEIIRSGIESHKDNYTRFLIITSNLSDNLPVNEETLNGELKASLYFQTLHRKGSLAMVLTTIATYGINLAKIQSHPVPSRNTLYGFYADLEIESRAQLDEVMSDLRRQTTLIEILGVYKRGGQNEY